MIKDGASVQFHYTLTVDDEVVDSSAEREPMTYVHGKGEIIPGLEEQLAGMKAGDKKTATISPEKAYGVRNPEAVQTIPKRAFRDPDHLSEGDVVSGEAQGQPFQATVADVGTEEITIDMNHPLAGKTLRFEVEIVEVG